MQLMMQSPSFVDREEMNVSEFVQKDCDSNIQRFINYHDSKLAVVKTLPFDPDKHPKTIQTRSIEHFHTFQAVKNQKGPQKTSSIIKPAPLRSESANINSLSYVEQELTTLPPEILTKHNIVNLLDLTLNRFERFPTGILHLKNLKILRIDHNRIKTLPSDLHQLQQLECLTLSYNLVQSFPHGISQMKSLTELNFEFNLINSIDPQITELKNLRILNMSRNRFSQFPTAFYKMISISELSFEWFKYASPPLASRQRGKEGEDRLNNLREVCEDLATKGQKGMNFLKFISIVSTSVLQLNALDETQRSLLHYSALYEDISVMKYIISYMPSLLDLTDAEGQTPLSLAIAKEKFLAARYLLKHGANPVKGGGIYGSPLHIATRKMNIQIVNDIIKLGENLNKIDSDGHTPLHHSMALMAEGNPKAAIITQFLLENGVNPNAKNKDCWAPLHLVVRKKDLKTIQWIFIYNREAEEVHGREDTFNLNKKGGTHKWTSLHLATYSDCPAIVEALAQADCDVLKRCLSGNTAKALVRGYGLTMKFIEKFEKSWIHKKVLFKHKLHKDQVEDFNLKSLNSAKEIGNASKNKFDNSYDRYDLMNVNQRLSPEDPCFLSYANRKLQTFVPFIPTQKVISNDHDDSFEILPEETDTYTNNSFGEEIETNRLDFYNELNENVTIQSKTFIRSSLMTDKNTANGAIKRVHHTRSPSKSKFSASLIQFFNVDISTYQNRLDIEPNFGLEYCKNEIRVMKECFQLERILFTEKMKIFTLLRMLYFRIVKHIKKNMSMKLSADTYALLPMKDSFAINFKNTTLASAKRQDVHLATMLYETVPQSLIEIYAGIGEMDFEASFMKKNIISMFEELVYYPAIDFLEAINLKSKECQFVKLEAKRVSSNLKNVYDTCVMNHAFNKENKCSSQNQNFKKPRSVKPQISANVEEHRQSAPAISGPHFNAKAVFIPVKISDHTDKIF